MNSAIKEMSETRCPRIETLSEKERKIYMAGLKLLATAICEEFLDIPELHNDRFKYDGLFYEIPYFNSDQLLTQGNQRMLLVVYKVENKSSFCPLRIDFKFDEYLNFWIYVYDQSGQRTIKRELMSREDGKYYTEIEGHETLKLSELIGRWNNYNLIG